MIRKQLINNRQKVVKNLLEKLKELNKKSPLQLEVWEIDSLLQVALEQSEKVERYKKVITIIADKTTCDDTWDFANRVLQDKAKTDLPYRISEV